MRRRLLLGLLAASAAVLAVLAFFAAGYLIGRWRTRREAVSSAPVVQALRRIVVRLPAPQILSVDDRLEWFDERSGWLNPITPADRTRWTQWARAALSRAAKDAGLYEKSTVHARDLFTDAAAAFGWTAEVTVSGTRVPSVQPATPATGTAQP